MITGILVGVGAAVLLLTASIRDHHNQTTRPAEEDQ